MQANLFKIMPTHQNENPKAAASAGKLAVSKDVEKSGKNFEDVLRSVSRPQKQDKQTEKKVKIVNEKLDKVEKKLKIMLQKASPEEKQKLEKLLSMLKKIKELLKEDKNKIHDVNKKVFKTENTDFLANIERVLDEIAAMTDQKTTNLNFEQIKTKLEDINNSLKEIKKSETDKPQKIQTKAVIKKDDKNTLRESKIKVRDLRRKTKEKPVQKKTDKKPAQKTRGLNTNQVKVNQSSARETAMNSENRQLNTVKLQEQVTRQYVSYSSPVSRANLEAMISGVTGKALVTLRDGKSELKMQLFPPALGRMSMKFTLKDGIMVGKIVVATAEAKMLFDQNLTQLQQSLMDAGVNVSQINVSVGGESGNEQQGLFDGQAAAAGISGHTESEDAVVAVNSLFDSSINFIA